jgi:hypothetical protein
MLKYILLCILAMSGYYAWSVFPVNHGPGITNPNRPELNFTAFDKPFNYKGNTLKPLKRYEADVRVLQKKRYLFDARASLSPMDILVGWNEMSDARNVDFIHFSMSNRTASMSYTKPPIPVKQIHQQMDHLHLIPSNKEIKSTINGLRQGHKIKLEGIIVNIESIDNYDWDSKTILTNKEEHRKLVVWVESIQVE